LVAVYLGLPFLIRSSGSCCQIPGCVCGGCGGLPLPLPEEGQSGSSGQWGATQQETVWPPFLGPVESSRLSSTISAFCPFCVRQKLLQADRNASNRLRPLSHTTPSSASKGLDSALRILPAALVSSGQGKLALGQPKGQSTSWPQGFLLRITVISTTGHCQRERERARNRQEGGKFRLPRFLLTDTETSDQKAVDQCPKAPVCPVRRSRWPSTQAGREDPESPFFWQDLFPRGDNGSILSSLGPLKASGDFRIPGHQTPSLGTKSAFRLHFPSPGWLCAKPARDTCWRPGRGGFGFRPLLVHLKGQVPWCGIHTAVLGTGRC